MRASPIRLIAGLGNPGSRYDETRHNAGFWFLDRIASEHRVSWKSESKLFGDVAQLRVDGEVVRLLKPTTFMNESGRSVGAVCRYFALKPEQVLVAHDEIDLLPGVVRLKRGGGHGGHNGLRDIIPQLGAPDFARLRIGVGHPGSKEQVIGYVLARAGAEQRALIDAAIDRAVERVDDMITQGLDRVMNELHRQPTPS
ncbi:MAG: PTH1 family peptidyl-tRNA hydrolase [Gammaproteobacteria bacterium]|jgi:PTH1 family peptidyl-tRNA hydrolase